MLYDVSRVGNLTPAWFDPGYWRGRGRVLGSAAGRGATLFVREAPHELAVRHYLRGGLTARVARDTYWYTGEWRTRPFREWCLTYHLHRRGLPVPVPLAARYLRRGLYYIGDLITERVPGARTLAERVVAGEVGLADWVAVGRCIRRFHDIGFCHADLNAHNVLFNDVGATMLIDLDRGRLRRPGLWCDSNLVRLRRSLLKITDVLPPGRFGETDWNSLLAGYARAAPVAAAAAAPAR
jgi:3-deoxy-D-manno-octulosonic acid kinase